jgi:HlyD family secretion protein
MLTTLAAGGLIFLAVSCSGGTTAAKPQIATVQKGNISILVTGTGNLALENKQELSFGQTGLVTQAVTVKISDVLVTPGQNVDAGQVLAKADPQDWQNQITADQHALDSRNVSLIQAKNSVINAQNGLTSSQASLVNAQAGLVTAQYNLSQQKDIKAAQDLINTDNNQLQIDQSLLQQAQKASNSGNVSWAQQQITLDTATLNKDQQNMVNLMTNPASMNASINDINGKITQVTQAQTSVVQAQANITQSQAGITQAQANVVTAQNNVGDAQTTLDEEKNSAQVITAPIKGLITKVGVNVGDTVSRSATLMEIAQPDLFQANIMVSERDIPSVKMGGDAAVAFDAFQNLNFPAKITQIAPLATVQQGVVNYQVTVELTSLRPTLSTAAASALQSFAQNRAGAGTTAAAGQAAGAGRASPGANGAAAAPASGSAAVGARPASGGGTAFAALAGQGIPLKDGLSATVNIPIQEKDGILLVPNRAISHQGKNTVVQVVSGTTTVATVVQTGISDSTNTEIILGLTEGEQISIPGSAAPAAPAGGARPGGGIPGLGGGLRIGG